MTANDRAALTKLAARIAARLGVDEGVDPDLGDEPGVILELAAATRVADLLDVLARIRVESITGLAPMVTRVWTVRVILRDDMDDRELTLSTLADAGAVRVLGDGLVGDLRQRILEVVAPHTVVDDTVGGGTAEWASRTAKALADQGYDAQPAPVWAPR